MLSAQQCLSVYLGGALRSAADQMTAVNVARCVVDYFSNSYIIYSDCIEMLCTSGAFASRLCVSANGCSTDGGDNIRAWRGC